MQADKPIANPQYIGDYQIHYSLPSGGQAQAKLATKGTKLYALKIYFKGQSKKKAFKEEATILQKLKVTQFPYLIKMVEYKQDAEVHLFEKNVMQVSQRPLIVLEFAEGGDLFDSVTKDGIFPPQYCRAYIKQLIEAVKYIHKQGISHRDITLSNILIGQDFKLKLADFGLATDRQGIIQQQCGTREYWSPQVSDGKGYFGLQMDIFAIGVVLFMMISGNPPFQKNTSKHDRVYKYIREKKFQHFWNIHLSKREDKEFFSQPFKRLINCFFSEDIAHRPTFESLENDDWLNGKTATEEQMNIFMKDRYNKHPNKLKLKIREVKQYLELIKSQTQAQTQAQGIIQQSPMKEENIGMKLQCAFEEDSDSDDDGRGQTIFLKDYQNCKLDENELQHYQKYLGTYVPYKLAFVEAWIKKQLNQMFKAGETFLRRDYFLDVKPYTFQVKETSSIQISITFKFDVEGDMEQLGVKGKFHACSKGIGIDWTKGEGSDFWLSSIIRKLNNCLKQIAQ